MDRVEAYELARKELSTIEISGYGVASEHIDTVFHKDVSAVSGTTYDVELTYAWEGSEHEEILVFCVVTSKSWFKHEHLEESITLCSRAI